MGVTDEEAGREYRKANREDEQRRHIEAARFRKKTDKLVLREAWHTPAPDGADRAASPDRPMSVFRKPSRDLDRDR